MLNTSPTFLQRTLGPPENLFVHHAHFLTLHQALKMDLRMDLCFNSNEEDDIFNTTVRDSETESIVYIVETPKYEEGALCTTVRRRSQLDQSTRFAFKILWKGSKALLKDVMVVLDDSTLEEVPVRQVLERAPGGTT